MNICAVETASLARLAQKLKHEIFIITMTNIEKALALKKYTNSVTKLLKKYHEFVEIFSQKQADILLKHHMYNHKIQIKSEKQSEYNSLYKMFQNELKVLCKYLNENLDKEFIKASSSSATALIIFV